MVYIVHALLPDADPLLDVSEVVFVGSELSEAQRAVDQVAELGFMAALSIAERWYSPGLFSDQLVDAPIDVNHPDGFQQKRLDL